MSEQVIRDTVNIHTAHHLVMKEATLVSSMKTGNIHTAHHLVMKEATLVSSTNTQFRINTRLYVPVFYWRKELNHVLCSQCSYTCTCVTVLGYYDNRLVFC